MFSGDRMKKFDNNDTKKSVKYCLKNLDLKYAKPSDEDFYQNLPFCVIDAVFSIGVRYSSTRQVVIRFCEYFNLTRIRDVKIGEYPDRDEQLSLSEFIKLYDTHTLEEMTEKVYNNRQRTSSTSGILKSEAVLKFSKVLVNHSVEYFQDLGSAIGNENFESDIKRIPGQTSGVALRYFYMLAGKHKFIKPDRMIMRFIKAATGKDANVEECQQIVTAAYKILVKDFPHLTPMLLDNQMWRFQRIQ